MRWLIDNDYLTMLSRLLIGGMLIYASIYKVIDPTAFAKSIWFYHMVPGKLINLMALIVPWLELLSGVGLILGIFYKGATLWTAAMMVVFIVALSSAVARGLDIDCGCFKASEGKSASAWRSLVFDLVAMIFIVQLLLSRSRRWLLYPKS